jgi:hypothetical protein
LMCVFGLNSYVSLPATLAKGAPGPNKQPDSLKENNSPAVIFSPFAKWRCTAQVSHG